MGEIGYFLNHKCSIIANPRGKTWRFAKGVYNYVKEKLEKDKERYKEVFISNTKRKLEKRLPQSSMLRREELSILAEIIYEEGERDIGEMIELNRLNIITFRDKEHVPEIEENIRGSNCFYFHDGNLEPNKWFTQLCTVNDAFAGASVNSIANVFTYKRFTRGDKKDRPRSSINTRVVARALNNKNTRVLTIEVHNDAIQGSYDIPFDNLYAFPTLINYLKDNHQGILEDLVVVSPDAGGGTRAEAFATRINGEDVVIGYKIRGGPGKVRKLKLREFKRKNVLIIDDLIDSGGTLIAAAREARKNGAKKVYCYATHALFTEGYDKVVRSFDKLFIGNTFRQPKLDRHKKVEVISFTELFGEAIYRINKNLSLSELFE